MEPGRSKTSWVWALCRPDAVVYRLLGTRSAEGATTVLGDYRGIVMSDGYAAYRALVQRGATRAGAHDHAGARLGARPPPVRGGGADVSGGGRDPRVDTRALPDGGRGAGDGGGRPDRAPRRAADSRGARRRDDPDLGHATAGAVAVGARQGARVHDRALAGARGLPRRRRDTDGQQRDATRPTRHGTRPQDALARSRPSTRWPPGETATSVAAGPSGVAVTATCTSVRAGAGRRAQVFTAPTDRPTAYARSRRRMPLMSHATSAARQTGYGEHLPSRARSNKQPTAIRPFAAFEKPRHAPDVSGEKDSNALLKPRLSFRVALRNGLLCAQR